jgi:hypothetical protein
MNLTNLANLRQIISGRMKDHDLRNDPLSPNEVSTITHAADALEAMDDVIRIQKREIEELRAELYRRAQTVAELSAAAEQLENGRTEIDNAAPALADAAELADLATDAYDALRALWPSPSQVGIVKVHLGAGAVTRDVKIAGRRLGAHLGLHDARDVARGLRKLFADRASGTADAAARIDKPRDEGCRHGYTVGVGNGFHCKECGDYFTRETYDAVAAAPGVVARYATEVRPMTESERARSWDKGANHGKTFRDEPKAVGDR